MPDPAPIFLSYPETARRFWFGDRCLDALREVGELVLNPTDRILSASEIAEIAGGCQVIVLDRLTAIDDAVLARLPHLLAVVRGGVDIRWIDVEAASRYGVAVTRVEAAYGPSVAEMVIGLMLAAARDIPRYAASYRGGTVPAVSSGQQIDGSTVGIIGFGVIARRLAAILVAMGAHVIAHDPYAAIAPPVTAVTLPELLSRSDFVIPLVVSTPETKGLLDEPALALMQPSAWLINCSRGDVVDEAALAAALDTGTLAGAALDVGMATDQMPPLPLAAHPRVISTPHVGGITRQSFESHALQAVEQARLVLRGAMPAGCVNGDAASRLRATSLYGRNLELVRI